ncbi:hypothetical protein PC39_06035 [Salinisphaera sp. PC39]
MTDMLAELATSPWLLLGAFILLAYTTEAMTGFGSIVIALSLGALVLPIEAMLPVLVPLNIVMTGFLAWRLRGHADRDALLRLILPAMTAGTAAGYLLHPWLGDAALKTLFGLLIVWFAARELWRSVRAPLPAARGRVWTQGWTLAAGVTHGLFASGGPLLVYALSGARLDKARFRATLIVVWFTLNSLLTAAFLVDGSLWPALPRVAAYLPLLPVGVILGEVLHRRVDEAGFRRAVFAVLLAAGLALAWPY